MIDLQEKKDCVGCQACLQRCPKHCIAMVEDEEGFLYPKVDVSRCIACGLCEKVCPVIHQDAARRPLDVYAAKNIDEKIRMLSSSGGVFTLLAEAVIGRGGVVFGAKFDKDWDVVHDYTETLDGLAAFRGSKYVQSNIDESYKTAETFLKSGREVLFSGTPCQVAGLRLYLRKDYEQLLTVDFVCHGVPSPGVWRSYLKAECARQCAGGKNTVFSHPVNPENIRIADIRFRDKITGWKKYSFSLTLSAPQGAEQNSVFLSETLHTNKFMRGFLANLYLRPSCYACPAKSFKSGSDITLGDFWGIQNVLPELDDDKGTGLLLINTEKGRKAVQFPELSFREVTYEDALRGNPSMEHSCRIPPKRALFYKSWRQKNLLSLIDRLTSISFAGRVRLALRFRLKKLKTKFIGRG